jgi:hypothetical protein
MSVEIAGVWSLVAWKRVEGDTLTYPIGADAVGILIYTPDGHMAVQMTGAGRPKINSTDALGGSAEERAAAYSTCLAYFGTYEVHEDAQGPVVIHNLEASLYPNWTGSSQSRPLLFDGNRLVLKTPPSSGPTGTVVNEISWVRA